MDIYNIADMALSVVDAFPDVRLDQGTIEAALRRYWSDKIAVVWCVDDVLASSRVRGVAVTESEAADALALALEEHDCNRGVTWDFIDACVDAVLSDKAASNGKG